MQSHSKPKTTRTTPPITRQSKNLTQNVLQKQKKTPPPTQRTSTPTELLPQSESKSRDFLYEDPSITNNQQPIILSTPDQPSQKMASQLSRSETDLLDNIMEVDPLSDSVTQLTYPEF